MSKFKLALRKLARDEISAPGKIYFLIRDGDEEDVLDLIKETNARVDDRPTALTLSRAADLLDFQIAIALRINPETELANRREADKLGIAAYELSITEDTSDAS